MINLYVKFNVHSSYMKQVIVVKSGGQTDGRRTDGRTRLVTTKGIRQNFGWGLRNPLVSMVFTKLIQRFKG